MRRNVNIAINPDIFSSVAQHRFAQQQVSTVFEYHKNSQYGLKNKIIIF